MKQMLALCLVLVFMLAGCGENETETVVVHKEQDVVKQVSAGGDENLVNGGQSVGSYGGTEVAIRPEHPVASDCLEVTSKGLSGKLFAWDINGINVQQSKSNRYCLKDAIRGDEVTVSFGDSVNGGTATVTVGNSLPRVIDTSFEFVAEGDAYVIEVTPLTEDADEDYVALSYQWLINGQVNEEYTENRLPAHVYQAGDNVQVKITPDDGYGTGRAYTSRSLNMLSAAPVITSQPPKSFEALEYTYQVEADDVDSSELTFTLEDAPEGMNIDTATGLITWPLAEVSAGEYQIKIIVTDTDGSTGRQEFTLNLEKRRSSKQDQE